MQPVRGELVARAFLLALLCLTIYLLFLIFRPFLAGIAWALFLGTAFHPVHRRLARRIGGRETLSAALTTALVATLIVLPAVMVVRSVARSVTAALPALEEAARKSRDGGTGEEGEKRLFPLVGRFEKTLEPYIDVEGLDLEGTAITTLRKFGQGLAEQSGAVVQNVLKTLLTFGIMIATMVFLFRDGTRLLETCRRFLPISERDKDEVFSLLHEVTRAVFYGVMMTALVQALIGTIGWMIVGLPAPMTAGILMFFCALLPVGGTSLVWGPGAIYLFLQGHWIKALVLTIYGFGLVGLIDNFLRPIFISGRTRMPLLLVFFGIFGGITAFGFTGLFLGPLVITLFLFLIEVVRRDLFQQGGRPPGASASEADA